MQTGESRRASVRWRVFAVALIGTSALLSVPLYHWWIQPTYQGKNVSFWFRAFCATGFNGNSPGKEALEKLGTHSIAFLTNRVASRTFTARTVYGRSFTNLPTALQKHLPNPYQRELERMEAVMALSALGPKAHDAVPIIIDYLMELPPGTIGLGIQSIRYLKPDASEVERLVEFLRKNTRYTEMKEVIDRCGVKSPGITKSLSSVIQAQGGADPWPFQSLREMGPDAVSAVPVLLQCLLSTDREVRYQAVRTFETIGPVATNAIPEVTRCLNDANSMVQSAAKRTLNAINNVQ